MYEFEALLKLVPTGPDWTISWDSFVHSPLEPLILDMSRTPQNPKYHGEGDVWTHTKLVCQALVEDPEFRNLPETKREILFLAALLHDAGKPACTRWEDDRWTSPNHGSVGAGIIRRLLWQDFGLCGTPERQQLRETICNLIRYHAVPAHIINDPDAHRRLRRIAANQALIPEFNLELLCLLSGADARGRICEDMEDMLYREALARELAAEGDCYKNSCVFYSNYSRFAYFRGRNILPEQPVHDDTWGEVLMVSGLPGTGKDTWIRENCRNLQVVSLDDIRAELKISPKDNQTPVIEEARERAKKLLRQKQPFVWNATDLSHSIRQRQVGLFVDYGAAVRIVYLETGWEEMLRRNQSRAAVVPEQAICRMMHHLMPPEIWEAHTVEWICV